MARGKSVGFGGRFQSKYVVLVDKLPPIRLIETDLLTSHFHYPNYHIEINLGSISLHGRPAEKNRMHIEVEEEEDAFQIQLFTL